LLPILRLREAVRGYRRRRGLGRYYLPLPAPPRLVPCGLRAIARVAYFYCALYYLPPRDAADVTPPSCCVAGAAFLRAVAVVSAEHTCITPLPAAATRGAERGGSVAGAQQLFFAPVLAPFKLIAAVRAGKLFSIWQNAGYAREGRPSGRGSCHLSISPRIISRFHCMLRGALRFPPATRIACSITPYAAHSSCFCVAASLDSPRKHIPGAFSSWRPVAGVVCVW